MKSKNKIDKPTLFAVALIVAVSGLIYELILGATASYLIGDSVKSYSLGIGSTLFGMGLGSLFAIKFQKDSARNFVKNELFLSFLGGNSVVILFAAFALSPWFILIYLLFSVAIGIGIGLEIPLVMGMAKQLGSDGDVNFLSKVLALDYIGALIGSLLFPFLLLPVLGLNRTAYAVAILNCVAALFILWRMKIVQHLSYILRIAAGLVLAILVVGFSYSSSVEKKLSAKSYNDPVIYYEFTPYQQIVMTQFKKDTRLYLNGHLQFSTLDEARYHELLVHSALTSSKNIESILVLGGGDGLAAREILKYDDVNKVTIVDLDPAMTELAANMSLLKKINKDSMINNKIKVVNEDAYNFTRDSDEKYDVIIADLIDPSSSKTAKLYSVDMYKNVLDLLNPGGIFITQSTSTFFTPKAYWMIFNSVSEAARLQKLSTEPIGLFQNVPSFGEWGFVMIGRSSDPNFSERPLPENLDYISKDRIISAQTPMPELENFRHNKTNSLFSPTIQELYQEDMRLWRY